MKIAFCVYGITEHIASRTEFYRQDLVLLRSLGHEVVLVTKPWRLTREFDLAFVWWWNHMAFWGPVARALRIPIVAVGVFDVNHFGEMSLLKRTVKRAGIRFPRINSFTSRFEVDRICDYVPMDRRTVRYSPLVVDTETYHPPDSPVDDTGPFQILNVAWQRRTNITRKMVPELLEAFARLHQHEPSSRLVLAGPPEDGAELLKEQAARLGVADVVEFPGELTLDAKIQRMQSCSLYCQVSRFEGFGLAVAEAMACGSPVLVSDAGSLPEVVADYGTYVDQLSVDGILAGLQSCLRRRREIRELATAGARHVQQEFSFARRRADFEQYIHEVTR